MKICVITDVPISIEHGMGQYINNLIRIFSIPIECVYNVFSLTDTDVEFINSYFEFVSVQLGILKKDQIGVADTLSKLHIPKIATIHSVVDEEVFWLKDCFTSYFPNTELGLNVLSGGEYNELLKQMNGFVFYTKSDMDIFRKHYTLDVHMKVISPSIQYVMDDIQSTRIKKVNTMGYLGRVDYRKGLIASLNSMEFLSSHTLNVYGLIMDNYNSVILNHFLSKNQNITYNGLLSDKKEYFDSTSIFFGNSLYEPFGFSHVENLFNFVVPIIGKGTGTHEVFGWDYPFVVEDSVPQLVDMVKRIEKMDETELYEILKTAQSNLIHLTDEYFRERYLETIKSIV